MRLQMARGMVLAVAVAIGVAAGAAAPGGALAQTNEARGTGPRFDVHLDVGWYRFFAVGFRVDIPIVPEGIIDSADDELALSLGAELAWFYYPGYSGFGVYPVLALQWNFYLSQKWSIFPELGVAFLFGPNRQRYWDTFAAPYGAFGVRYHFSARNALLFRVGWPSGFQIGITF